MSLVASYIAGEFPCAIVKSDAMGHLCGYIGVPPGHPWYAKHYDDVSADVHGGLTFVGASRYGHPAIVADLRVRIERGKEIGFPLTTYERILAAEHEKAGEVTNFPIETELDIWWLGFDCAHGSDVVPGIPSTTGTYKDEGYVRGELEGLAEQAANAQRTVPA